MPDKNGCSVLYVFNWRECWEGSEFLGAEPIPLIYYEYMFGKLRFSLEAVVTKTDNTERAIAMRVGPFP